MREREISEMLLRQGLPILVKSRGDYRHATQWYLPYDGSRLQSIELDPFYEDSTLITYQ
jgi:hypothetical protein